MTDTRSSMSNPQVADLLGVHYTYVSRLRSGRRLPSISTMAKIKELFDWDYESQVKAVLSDDFHVEFEKRLASYATTP